jgi:hypothetical protein
LERKRFPENFFEMGRVGIDFFLMPHVSEHAARKKIYSCSSGDA